MIMNKDKVGMVSSVGNEREGNEDSVGVTFSSFDTEKIFYSFFAGIVCDGVGGGVEGKMCSKIAVNTFLRNIPIIFTVEWKEQELITQIDEIIHLSHKEIVEFKTKKYGIDKMMGTTATGLIIFNKIEKRKKSSLKNEVFLVNVGDSRAYGVYNNKERFALQQLTEDHIEIREGRKGLIRVLGMRDEMAEASIYHIPQDDLAKIKEFLLCTDGLYSELPENEIRLIYQKNQYKTPESICFHLLTAVYKTPARDDVTMLIYRF